MRHTTKPTSRRAKTVTRTVLAVLIVLITSMSLAGTAHARDASVKTKSDCTFSTYKPTKFQVSHGTGWAISAQMRIHCYSDVQLERISVYIMGEQSGGDPVLGSVNRAKSAGNLPRLKAHKTYRLRGVWYCHGGGLQNYPYVRGVADKSGWWRALVVESPTNHYCNVGRLWSNRFELV